MATHTDELSRQVAACLERLEDPDAPALNVHTIGEYMYCYRAGELASGSELDDTGTEPAVPALGGLPWHDVDKIQAAMEELAEHIKLPVACNLGLWLFALCLWFAWGTLFAFLMAPAFYFNGRWLWRTVRDYRELKGRLREAEDAAQAEPDWGSTAVQPVNWWSLIRAGFVSEEKQSLTDRQIRLSGRPWRVLHRENRVYPVIRISTRGDVGDVRRYGDLRPQHLARIAAYSYLLHRGERAESSWAIVLFDRSDDGIAVPITEKAWAPFREAVNVARNQIRIQQRNPKHAPEPNKAACIRCPLGKPHRHDPKKPTMSGGIALPPHKTVSQEGHAYHSSCGDRFRWLPPHEDNRKRGL